MCCVAIGSSSQQGAAVQGAEPAARAGVRVVTGSNGQQGASAQGAEPAARAGVRVLHGVRSSAWGLQREKGSCCCKKKEKKKKRRLVGCSVSKSGGICHSYVLR